MKDASLWLGIGGLAVAALTLILNYLIEIYRAKRQLELKRYEVEFLERRNSFVELFGAIRKLIVLAANREWIALQTSQRIDESLTLGQFEELTKAFDKESTAFYAMMPFLPASDHEWIEAQSQTIEGLIRGIWFEPDRVKVKLKIEEYEAKVRALRKELFGKLFGASVGSASERHLKSIA